MKATTAFIIILLLASCAGTQPRPAGNGWDICPTCHGEGFIVSAKLNGSSEESIFKRDEITAKSDAEDALTTMQNEGAQKQTSLSYKKNKCRTCKGRGWVRKISSAIDPNPSVLINQEKDPYEDVFQNSR